MRDDARIAHVGPITVSLTDLDPDLISCRPDLPFRLRHLKNGGVRAMSDEFWKALFGAEYMWKYFFAMMGVIVMALIRKPRRRR